MRDGFLALPRTPGLGVEMNEASLDKYKEQNRMKRRHFLEPRLHGRDGSALERLDLCGCSMFAQAAAERDGMAGVASGVKITGMKVFGVSLTPDSDRPYVFVKLETNQGVVGWGEGTLEGKAGAVMACIEDFREFLIGSDPMQVEHHWQSMYVHSFYRAGPVIGSAISGIDQALWDIRGKVLGHARVQAAGRSRSIPAASAATIMPRRAHAEELCKAARNAPSQQGVILLQDPAFPATTSGSRRTPEDRSTQSQRMQLLREGLGPDIDIGVDFHAKTSPSVASIIVKEVEPLNLLFIEEPCPPENVAGHGADRAALDHADRDRRAAGRVTTAAAN